MDPSASKIFWFSLRVIQLLVSVLILGLGAYGMPFPGNNTTTNLH
jgi:hypothetical protein